MKKEIKADRLEVETEDAVYEIEFGQIQVEITGRCNMRCEHCRAANQLRKDMPLEQVVKIVRFATRFSGARREVVISGGEPLLHREFPQVLRSVRDNGVDVASITTNGSLLTEKHLQLIESLSFQRFALSVSLDSVNQTTHDNFRRHKGAFTRANDALRLIADSKISGLTASMRSTIQPSQLAEMESLVDHARNLGCNRIGFSAVQPSGRATGREDLLMSKDQKKAFLEQVYRLDAKFPDIDVTTTDPLKCLICSAAKEGSEGELVFNGCGAAAVTFNVDADGVMTPCALLDIPIMNVFALSEEEMIKSYQNSPIVRNMLMMNLKGKCGQCRLKYECGGCRARALAASGDYLGEDPHCWV